MIMNRIDEMCTWLQMRIALTRLLERFPGLRLDPDRPPVFGGWEFRAPQHLHVRLDG